MDNGEKHVNNQSINRNTYQSVIHTLTRSFNQSIDRSIDQSIDRSINQYGLSICQSISQSIKRPAEKFGGKFIHLKLFRSWRRWSFRNSQSPGILKRIIKNDRVIYSVLKRNRNHDKVRNKGFYRWKNKNLRVTNRISWYGRLVSSTMVSFSFCSTSRPSDTSPNTVWTSSRYVKFSPSVIKNWEPCMLLPLLAMESVPILTCFNGGIVSGSMNSPCSPRTLLYSRERVNSSSLQISVIHNRQSINRSINGQGHANKRSIKQSTIRMYSVLPEDRFPSFSRVRGVSRLDDKVSLDTQNKAVVVVFDFA